MEWLCDFHIKPLAQDRLLHPPLHTPPSQDLELHGLGEDARHWSRVLDFDWIKSTPSPNWSLL